MKQKKIPLRKCLGCMEMKPKRELIRIVRSPEKTDENGNITEAAKISLDLTGKTAGRGAYICNSVSCFERARKARRPERSLGCAIPDEVYDSLSEQLRGQTE